MICSHARQRPLFADTKLLFYPVNALPQLLQFRIMALNSLIQRLEHVLEVLKACPRLGT